MEDVEFVKLLETLDEADEDIPDGLLGHLRALLQVAGYLSCEVAVACEFHHNTV
jgi:hypothetical protein